jgi:integrase
LNQAGRPHTHRATVIFRETVRALGITNLRFHDLRHDFATRVRRKGVGLDAIAKLLGHTTLAMTQRYAHLGMDTLRDAVADLDIDGSMTAPAKPTSPTGATILKLPPKR